MSLTVGTRLGPYEIVSLIGAGGMGEVYTARDTRLDRTVAIKILAPDIADPEHRARFEREARVISSMSHPDICAIHDVGAYEGGLFLVMEHVVGETLAARLSRRPLPLAEALSVGARIAGALAEAHKLGIVHRDLKPSNVMLTKGGIKLLDFGVAKLRPDGRVGALAAATVPTASAPLTDRMTVVGTLNYMAPEQLEGREVDGRADLWSLGVVLYEMIGGVQPFKAATPASMIAAVLDRNPTPLSTLVVDTPPAVERAVKRCLAKDPDERWQSALDFADELSWLGESLDAPLRDRARSHRFAIAAVALVGVACLGLGFFAARVLGRQNATAGDGAVTQLPLRASFALADGLTLTNGIALSPDGRTLAVTATGPSHGNGIWLQDLDSSDARLLPGTEGALDPFWSSDGLSLGFFAADSLKRVAVAGGPPQMLAGPFTQGSVRGGAWNRFGTIVFGYGAEGPLLRVSERGGTATPLTNDRRHGAISDRFPTLLPDGNRVLLLASSRDDPGLCVALASLDPASPPHCLTTGESTGMYHDGRLFYVRGRTLVSRAFDPTTGRVSGEAVPAVERVWRGPGVYGRAGCASGGRLIACRHGGPSRLFWVDASGRGAAIPGPEDSFNPVLAPDGRRLAIQAGIPDTQRDALWIVDGTAAWMLSGHEMNVEAYAWSPDGKRIVFGAQTAGTFDLYVQPVERGSVERLLFESPDFEVPTDWSSDGQWILFDRNQDIWRIASRGGEPLPVMRSAAIEGNARFSPDMRWIAYQSNESGRMEVYIVPFGRAGDPIVVSSNGATGPQWRADGRALFFLALDGSVVSVAIDTRRDAPLVGSREVVLRAGTVDSLEYEWAFCSNAKGDRFVVNTPPDPALSNRISLLVDWKSRDGR